MGKATRLTAGLVMAACALTASSAMALGVNEDSIPRLPTVHVRSRGAGVHVRNDTVEYQASAYKGPEVRKVQDLLARLEGFNVSPDGRVHFNGQEIETILLNGEDMTGTNYRLLSKYLRAGLVKKIQLIHDYDPDPLMREMRRSGKIGLSLVLYDSLSRSLSGGADIGATAAGRKDMDLHLVNLQGPRKAIALGKWNGTGETVTGNRDFYARDETQDIAFSTPPDHSSPAQVGIISPPALPQPYVRGNRDVTGSVIWKQKIGAGRLFGMTFGLDRNAIEQAQEKSSRFALPDGTTWAMIEQESTLQAATSVILRSELTEDRGRHGRGRVLLDLYGMSGRCEHEDMISGAWRDDVHESERLKASRVSGRVQESWRARGGALMLDANMSWQREQQRLDLASDLKQFLRSQELREDFLLKYVAARRKHSGGWGVRYRGLEGQRSAIWLVPGGRSGTMIFGTHAITIEGEWERKCGRNARWQFAGNLGAGGWQTDQDVGLQVLPLHDIAAGFQRQAGPFRAWSLAYRDARVMPGEQYALPMEIASGGYTLIAPQRPWIPSALHRLSFNFTTRSLAAGAGMMLLFRYTRHANDIVPALEMSPGHTRVIPMAAEKSDDLVVTAGGDLYLEPARMKLTGDLHMTMRRGKVMVNQVRTDRVMHNSGVGLRLASAWRAPVNVDMSMNLDNNRYLDQGVQGKQIFSTWSNTIRVKLKARWQEQWYAALTVESVSTSGLPSFMAMDLHLSWQCHEKLTFSLTGHNMLGRTRSVTRWVGAGVEGETVYRVVPAYVLWKLSWALG